MAEMFPVENEEFSMEISDAPPADLLIKIQSFSKLWMHGVEKHESSSFLAGNYKWKLIIYPNGRECKNDGDHISVYLSVTDTDSLPAGWEISANLSIFLHNQISDNYFCFRGKARRFDAKNPKWGFSMSKRILTEASNGYLVDDKCSFGAEVFLRQTHASLIECLSLLDWKISDFFSKLKRVWTSKEFLVGGLRWKMQLYPNGNRSGKGKSVSIYLECAELKSFVLQQKVKADLIIRIKNKLPQHHVAKSSSHWFTSREDDWGFTNFIPIADICDPSKGFIINDCCFLETQISVLDVVYTPKQVKGLAH